jgi:hypothetical protein
VSLSKPATAAALNEVVLPYQGALPTRLNNGTYSVQVRLRQYCAKGVQIEHKEYALSHFTSVAVWLPQAIGWVNDRFRNKPVPQNCASIQPGNPLDLVVALP